MFNILIYILTTLSMDYAIFRLNDTLSLVELYIAIPYTSLAYTDYNGEKRADFQIGIQIEEEEGAIIAEYKFERVSFIPSLEEARERTLTMIDLFSLSLPQGRYSVYLSVNHEGNEHRINTGLRVSLYKGFSISDIMLGSKIEDAFGVDKFRKGEYQIIPNPERRYGGDRNIVYIYTELYGLSVGEEYSLIYRLKDVMGNLITEYPEKTRVTKQSSINEIGGINTVGLSSGSYLIEIELSQDRDTVHTSKVFYIVSIEREPSILDGIEREYYSFIEYIATPEDLARYEASDDKDDFFEEFWARKGRETLSSHVERVKKADDLYGKESDRGRIFLIYGEPDEVRSYAADLGYPDCEVWWYYGAGGRTFVFSDKWGIGRYELIYSSDVKEYTDPRYYRYIPPSLLQSLH